MPGAPHQGARHAGASFGLGRHWRGGPPTGRRVRPEDLRVGHHAGAQPLPSARRRVQRLRSSRNHAANGGDAGHPAGPAGRGGPVLPQQLRKVQPRDRGRGRRAAAGRPAGGLGTARALLRAGAPLHAALRAVHAPQPQRLAHQVPHGQAPLRVDGPVERREWGDRRGGRGRHPAAGGDAGGGTARGREPHVRGRHRGLLRQRVCAHQPALPRPPGRRLAQRSQQGAPSGAAGSAGVAGQARPGGWVGVPVTTATFRRKQRAGHSRLPNKGTVCM
mmetsp:Transcript_35574/g.92416  ORF Transcript_35574/g.92416 Transcript_35574/m.92416 type:complete len:275 (+) Transcript_35574:1655-2479(+)